MEQNITENIEKSLSGDHAAFGEIINAYLGMVYGVALNITGDYTESEDIAQESFLYAFQKLKDLSDPARFGSWLYSIVRRTSFKTIQKRYGVLIADVEELLGEKSHSDTETPAEIYARKEISDILWAEVADLPSKTREAIFLYYIEDYSVKRIADFLGISEGAVKMRLKFGREKLRETLADKLEMEIKRHKPSDKTKNAIIAALPFATVPLFQSNAPQEPSPAGKGSSGILNHTLEHISNKPLQYLKNKWTKLVFAGFLVSLSIFFYLVHSKTERGNIHIDDEKHNQSSFTNPLPEKQENVFTGNEAIPNPDKNDINPVFLIKGNVIQIGTLNPVPGMRIHLSRSGKYLGNRKTEENGVFEFPNLPEAWYDLTFEPQDELFFDHYWQPEMTQRIRVNLLGRDFMEIEILVRGGTFIAGKVIDDLGQPVPGASVYFISYSDQTFEYYPMNERITDSLGRFKFSGLYPEAYFSYEDIIGCEAPGYGKKIMQVDPRPSFESPVDDIVFQLIPGEGGVISGRVVNREGEPLESVVILAQNKAPLIYKKAVCAKADGQFVFRSIPPGRIEISDSMERGSPLSINLTENKKVEDIEMALDIPLRNGMISGIFMDEDEAPVKGAMIYAFPLNNRQPVNVTLTDNEGKFEMLNMEEGQIVRLLHGLPCQNGRYPTNADDISVPSKGLFLIKVKDQIKELARMMDGLPNIDISKREIIKVCGSVKFADTGKFAEKFSLFNDTRELYENEAMFYGDLSGSAKRRKKTTDIYTSNGEFEIFMEKVAGTTPSVGVWVEGYSGESERPQMVKNQGFYKVDFILHRAKSDIFNLTVKGKVVDAKGEPVIGAEISSGGLEKAISGEDGAFSLESGWTLYAPSHITSSHPDYAISSAPLPIDYKDAKVDLLFEDVIIQLKRGGMVAGIVTDRNGSQIAHVRVKLESQEFGENEQESCTNQDGYYQFERVPSGKYRVSIRIPFEESRVALVEEGELAEINFGVLGSTLYGTVTENGRPLAFVRMVLNNYPELAADASTKRTGRDDVSIATTTDKTGFYKFQGLPPGTLYLKIFDGDYALSVWDVDIPRDEEIERNYDLLTGSISGKVVNAEKPKFLGNGRYPFESRIIEVRLLDNRILEFISGNSDSYLCARKVRCDSKGNFEFSRVLGGIYILSSFSSSGGETFEKVDLKPGESKKDIVLEFRSLGSIRVETIDADTGENLHLWGNIHFVQGEKQVITRFFRELTPIIFNDINMGDSFVYAGLFAGDESNPETKIYYNSEWEPGVKIEPGKETHLSLKMRKGQWFSIAVQDADGNPYRGYHCQISDDRGSWNHYVFIYDNLIQGRLPPGVYQLSVFKGEKNVYRDDFEVKSDQRNNEYTIVIPRE